MITKRTGGGSRPLGLRLLCGSVPALVFICAVRDELPICFLGLVLGGGSDDTPGTACTKTWGTLWQVGPRDDPGVVPRAPWCGRSPGDPPQCQEQGVDLVVGAHGDAQAVIEQTAREVAHQDAGVAQVLVGGGRARSSPCVRTRSWPHSSEPLPASTWFADRIDARPPRTQPARLGRCSAALAGRGAGVELGAHRLGDVRAGRIRVRPASRPVRPAPPPSLPLPLEHR